MNDMNPTPTPGAVPTAPAGNASQSDAGGPADDQTVTPVTPVVDPMVAPAVSPVADDFSAPAAMPAPAMDMAPAMPPADEPAMPEESATGPVVGGEAVTPAPASAEEAPDVNSTPVAPMATPATTETSTTDAVDSASTPPQAAM